MLLTASPNATVNRFMSTKILDDGSFWRFIDPPPAMLAVGLGGLGIAALGYLYIIVRITIFRQREFATWTKSSTHKPITRRHISIFKRRVAAVAAAPRASGSEDINSVISRQAAFVVLDWLAVDSSSRKIVSMAMKLGDLTFQFILLFEFMERGLATVLVASFAALIVFNALWTALATSHLIQATGLTQLLVDTSFSIATVIGFNMAIVAYCTSTDLIDRRALAINLDIFPPGWFERGASTVSDSIETEVIRTAFNSLRIFSKLSAFARVVTNLALCRRFYQIAARVENPETRNRPVYPKKRLLSVLLVLLATAVVVFVEESLRTSDKACRLHPECVQNARRWIQQQDDDEMLRCPCLAMIDVDTRVKTFDEWLNPPDVTLKVAQLAVSGDLQTIKLINRQLPALPDELRRCTRLKHLSLMYTHTKALPVWMKEFTELEYLHIENDLVVSSRTDLPLDIFDAMAALTFIHLGINDVHRLPSLDGLTNLKSLAVALFLHLEELPSFHRLGNLERLVLGTTPLVRTVPDLAATPKLSSFAVSDRGEFCCNGFLGECDLSDSKCGQHLMWGTPPATCLSPNETATAATRSMFSRFPATVCAGEAIKPGQLETGPTPEAMRLCNGTMYKRCAVSGYDEAMCYNPRLMGVMCDHSPLPIKARRLQIAEGVGDSCDPEVEAWLGCQ